MKKFSIMILIIILTFPLLGCQHNSNRSLTDIETDLLASVSDLGMVKGEGKDLKRFYGLNANDFDEYLIYIPSNYMDVSEMLIVKSNDSAQIDLAEDAIETRVAKQQESFSGYGPEQCALLDNYELKIIGNTLFYCVSRNATDLKDAFVASMKK
ncbi:DUF4358 domain-containing protein [Acetobacterium paludosum]|uniref:DUF4358 domain-containing protein n=1 Tax=Acetobacterium paludosum TaxID=52693 RepID=A0A923HWY9_9FIRM|nr:DUF4358 domain-containing protein [Acetobacterium paludosum]MBC3888687.1 DUF4358 domain-containing protein [Acetobacterium paludosum]